MMADAPVRLRRRSSGISVDRAEGNESAAITATAAIPSDLLEAPVEGEQRVTALELFFDLVSTQ